MEARNVTILLIGVALLVSFDAAGAATKKPSPSIQAVQLPATGMLTTDDLAAVAARTSAYRPHDSFATPMAGQQLAGRQFRVVTPFHELTDAGGPRMGRNGGWTYLVDTQTLKLTIWPNIISPFDYRESDPDITSAINSGEGFTVVTSGKFMPSYVGENAFGAKRLIRSVDVTGLLIAEVQHDVMDPVFPHDIKNTTSAVASWDNPIVELKLAPEDARQVTKTLVLAVYGTIQPYRSDRTLVCGISLAPATLDRPRETLFHECLFSAHIDRYAIEDTVTGKSLAEWRNDENQQAHSN